jgi:hypothetical protein
MFGELGRSQDPPVLVAEGQGWEEARVAGIVGVVCAY